MNDALKQATYLLAVFLLAAPTAGMAREGLFVRFSLGPGIIVGMNAIKGEGLAGPAKDHAIGYGVSDGFAVQVADFGGVLHKQVGEFKMQNLDGLGLGAVMALERDLMVSLGAGYGQVAFARNWRDPIGVNIEGGLAVTASVRKEWPVGKRWAVGAGPQVFLFRTFGKDYELFGASLMGSVTFYLEQGK